ncbi:putative acetyltransferase, partial [Cellulosimicrobium funkei]
MPDSPWTTWAPGTRVVVRRRLSPDDAAAAGKPLTDVIGVVVETTATTLV